MIPAGTSLVPWIVAWSGETPFEIRPCRWAQNRPAVWQPNRPGEGRPLFAFPHAVRQRKAMVRNLCSICGEWVPATESWHFGGRSDGRHVVTTEPPMHHRCARIALDRCPNLRDSAARIALATPAATKLILQLVGGRAVLEDFGLEVPAARPVVGHVLMAWRVPQ